MAGGKPNRCVFQCAKLFRHMFRKLFQVSIDSSDAVVCVTAEEKKEGVLRKIFGRNPGCCSIRLETPPLAAKRSDRSKTGAFSSQPRSRL